MSLLSNTIASEEHGANFYNGVATQSLRFDDGRNTELTRSPAGATDQKKYTLSCWVKRTNLGSDQTIFSAGDSGSGNPGFEQLNFTSGNALRYYRQIGSVGNTEYVTTQVFRDVSAWYNIVVMMDAANTIGYIYVNGVRVTSFSTTNHPTNADGAVNSTQKHAFGNRSIDGSSDFDGYLAEVNFLDGLIVGETSGYLDQFGELKNGVWIPKAYSGSYGTNGYRLDFADNAVDAPTSEGTVDTDNIGSDSSGEHNNWTSDGIVASDCAMLDSPENNFATYNPLQISAPSSSFFLSEGNLALTATTNSGYRNCSATFSPMGFKGYIELVASALNHKIGIIADTTHPTNADYAGSGPQHVTLEYDGEVKFPNNDTSFRSASDHNLGTLATGDVMGMAFDFTGTNRNVWFHRANTYGTASGGLGNPATGANPIVTASNLNLTGPYRFHFGINNGPVLRINFGQDGTFGGTETAQGNTDDNGIGDFYYDVPAGFLAMCSANLPEPTIGANSDTQADDHFNTVLWNGGSGDVNVPVPFKPDWVWMKARSNAQNHSVGDSSRGGEKFLSTSRTASEGNDVNELHFTDDGFTSNTDWHTNNYTYVAWNWKANGNNKTSFSESGNNPAGTHQANQTAGFSIVSYTGTGSAGTVAHGLGVAPSMIIAKARGTPNSSARSWFVYHRDLGASAFVYLDLTNAQVTSNTTVWGGVTPSTTVFSLGNEPSVNFDAENYIAYCFAEVEGYSKFGSYIGNGSADGTFVYTGFRPAWIMMKASSQGSAGYAWFIQDTTRNPTNTNSLNHLFAERNLAENDSSISTATNNVVDVLSNGFKCRQGGNATNGGSVIMIYMAFAESPFKYANAR